MKEIIIERKPPECARGVGVIRVDPDVSMALRMLAIESGQNLSHIASTILREALPSVKIVTTCVKVSGSARE